MADDLGGPPERLAHHAGQFRDWAARLRAGRTRRGIAIAEHLEAIACLLEARPPAPADDARKDPT